MRPRLLFLFTFLLLVIYSVPYASGQSFPNTAPIPQVCSSGLTTPITSSGAGVGLALIALTVSFDVVAIAFAISRLFPNLGIRNWLQNEYWEIAKSAIIIVSIYGAIMFVGNLSYAIAPSSIATVTHTSAFTDITPLVAGAEGYLCNVNQNLLNIWGAVGIMSAGTGFWSSVQLGFYIPIPFEYVTTYSGVQFLPFANWMLQTGNFYISPFSSIINDLVNFMLFPFSALIIGLITTLPSFAYIGLVFFIPLGIMFRAFPFIRGIGGSLIAIGVALCLVIPATFILFNYQATTLIAGALPISVPTPSIANGVSCQTLFSNGSGFFGSFFCILTALPLTLLSPVINFISPLYQSLSVFSLDAIFVYLNQIFSIGFYIIVQMLLFVFDMIIIYPLVDAIARAMGGSIRLSLGGKLKLA
ncbi:MAG: hypothetical protein ACYCO0_01565 [Candidatus Micrarchaeaceae archaeon]